MKNIKMLYYDRTAFSEGTDVNKTSESKECYICHWMNWETNNDHFCLI